MFRILRSAKKTLHPISSSGLRPINRCLATISEKSFQDIGSSQYSPQAKLDEYYRLSSNIRSFSKDIESGQTALHLLIGSDISLHEKIRLLNELINFNSEVPAEMSKITCNSGSIPIELLDKAAPRGEPSRKEILAILYGLVKHNNISDHTEIISAESLIKNYYPSLNAELKYKFTTACDSVNTVRSLLKYSPTHPSMNQIDSGERQALDNVIQAMRASCTKAKIEIAKMCDLDVYLSDQIKLIILQLHCLGAIAARAGNCHEYAMLTVDTLKKCNPHIRVEAFRIDNGDHAFTVIDRDTSSNPFDYTTWGNNTIICDSHLGKVFFVNEIPQLLTNSMGLRFPMFNSHVHVVTSFNPNYHMLRPIFSEMVNTQYDINEFHALRRLG